MRLSVFDRDSPDDFQSGVNICALPSFPQGRREVWTPFSPLGSSKWWPSGRIGDLAWHSGAPVSSVVAGSTTIERFMLALVAVAVVVLGLDLDRARVGRCAPGFGSQHRRQSA
jgi:hypothetical protein